MEEGTQEANLAGAGADGGGGSHHLLDWLHDSLLSFTPSLLDDPYEELNNLNWWNHDDLQLPSSPTAPPTDFSTPPSPAQTVKSLSKKRKHPASMRRRQESKRKDELEDHRRKKQSSGSREARWAEQLLVPCAAAIVAGNPSRVQHLLYVLRELAAPAGDANHRLAAHGFRSLAAHLGGASPAFPSTMPPPTYAVADPKLFRSAVIKFHEVSPWFALPNALANAAIVRALEGGPPARKLHVIDFGVSHGVQWPTLLEALTRRTGGPPPLVQLTIIGAGPAPASPFSTAPRDYDFSVPLLRYASSINLNLRINNAESLLDVPRRGDKEQDETAAAVVVCAQFRVGYSPTDQRAALVEALRGAEPDLLIFSELDWHSNHGGEQEMGFLEGFGRRAGMLWSFLESTAAAFKGRECPERAVVEGEAAGWLDPPPSTSEARMEAAAEWRERMVAVGFREEGLREEAVETGRALLRKYDNNWELRPTASAGEGTGLWWKGQPVSCFTLWKLPTRRSE